MNTTTYIIAGFFWLIILAVTTKYLLLPSWRRVRVIARRFRAYLGRWRASWGVFLEYKSTLADTFDHLLTEIEKLEKRIAFQETVEVKRETSGQRRINFDLPRANGNRVTTQLPIFSDGHYVWPRKFKGAQQTGYGVWSVSAHELSESNKGRFKVGRNKKVLWVDELQQGDRELELDWKLVEELETV
jgi:hypothetical protein